MPGNDISVNAILELLERLAVGASPEDGREARLAMSKIAGMRHELAQLRNLTKALPRNLGPIGDLPEALLEELTISKGDELENQIVTVINAYGGEANLDQILVGLYRKFETVHQRKTVQNKAYRMAKADMIFAVDGKKATYSIDDPSQPKVATDSILEAHPTSGLGHGDAAESPKKIAAPVGDEVRFAPATQNVAPPPPPPASPQSRTRGGLPLSFVNAVRRAGYTMHDVEMVHRRNRAGLEVGVSPRLQDLVKKYAALYAPDAETMKPSSYSSGDQHVSFRDTLEAAQRARYDSLPSGMGQAPGRSRPQHPGRKAEQDFSKSIGGYKGAYKEDDTDK